MAASVNFGTVREDDPEGSSEKLIPDVTMANEENEVDDGKSLGKMDKSEVVKLTQQMNLNVTTFDAYESDLDEKRFNAFKSMMDQSEKYTGFLIKKMTTQVAARNYEWSRKQSLMKFMEELYKRNGISCMKYIEKKVPDSNGNSRSLLNGEMLNSAGEVVSMKQPFSLENATLRQYQIDGLDWLKTLYEYGINGILADEMGLGKTIQTISAIAHLYEMGVNGLYLVVAPLSTLYNWMAEFQRFAPKIPVILYHGNRNIREELRKELKTVDFFDLKASPVIVTSYEIAIRDRTFFHQHAWRYLIVDEGHRLKNFQCRLVRELKSLKTNCRLILTGTPLQNNLAELWSLMNFLLPEVFADLCNFESWFDADGLMVSENCDKIIKMERDQQVLSTMHKILRPFVLRRKKSDVDINLPPKKEVIVYAPLTELQKSYYKATLDKSIAKVLGLEEAEQEEECQISEEEEEEPPRKRTKLEKNKISKKIKYGTRSQEPLSSKRIKTGLPTGLTNVKMRNITMQLRKVTNHPYLIHFPYHPDTEEVKIDEELVKCCGKLLVLDAMLSRLKAMGHKILLFSQMTLLMDILEEYLEMRNYDYVRFDGSSKIEERQAAIETFSKKETFIFLLSTRAGGLGINLTAADTVIIYDSDWKFVETGVCINGTFHNASIAVAFDCSLHTNSIDTEQELFLVWKNPQCDFQAIDRCHRIGQMLPVVIYRLVTNGTIDERIVELARAKTKLEAMIIEKGKFKFQDENAGAVSIHELQELLDTKDTQLRIQPNGFVFSDEELDSLLDRSAILSGLNKSSNVKEKTTPLNRGRITALSSKKLNFQVKNNDRVYKIVDS